MLHTVNKSPFEKDTFESCLEHAAKGSAVLLIEDGVYAVLKGSTAAAKAQQFMGDITFYALEPDVNARGIQGKVIDGVNLVDYAGFVDLTVKFDRVQSWL
ncbi:MAG: sulfurtransferase complex subunit TusB [Thiohalomonadaceae bacterium]|jgi:tRNA 2-thiouridine synthesizing protein B